MTTLPPQAPFRIDVPGVSLVPPRQNDQPEDAIEMLKEEQRYEHLQPRQEDQQRKRAVKALERLGYRVTLDKVA